MINFDQLWSKNLKLIKVDQSWSKLIKVDQSWSTFSTMYTNVYKCIQKMSGQHSVKGVEMKSLGCPPDLRCTWNLNFDVLWVGAERDESMGVVPWGLVLVNLVIQTLLLGWKFFRVKKFCLGTSIRKIKGMFFVIFLTKKVSIVGYLAQALVNKTFLQLQKAQVINPTIENVFVKNITKKHTFYFTYWGNCLFHFVSFFAFEWWDNEN